VIVYVNHDVSISGVEFATIEYAGTEEVK